MSDRSGKMDIMPSSPCRVFFVFQFSLFIPFSLIFAISKYHFAKCTTFPEMPGYKRYIVYITLTFVDVILLGTKPDVFRPLCIVPLSLFSVSIMYSRAVFFF